MAVFAYFFISLIKADRVRRRGLRRYDNYEYRKSELFYADFHAVYEVKAGSKRYAGFACRDSALVEDAPL